MHIRFFPTVSKFLITTGRTGLSGFVTESEMIDLSESGNYQCSNWIDYPIGVQRATGGLVGDLAVICGGWSGIDAIDECYKVTANKAVLLGKMTTKRAFAASVVINDFLWVTGGWIKDNEWNTGWHFLTSTNFVYLNGSIQKGNLG